MTDYSELVKKLRDLHRDPRPASAEWLFENQVALYDAAAAIEELHQIAGHYEQTAKDYWKEACEYKAQLPKRGEIVRCGECKYQRPEALVGSVYCRKHRFVKSADWFCADGEREVQE